MRILATGRQTGKTTNLILRSALTGAVIITPTEHQAEFIEQQAKIMGVKLNKPMTMQQMLKGGAFGNRMDGRHIALIDDLAACLASLRIFVDEMTLEEDIEIERNAKRIAIENATMKATTMVDKGARGTYRINDELHLIQVRDGDEIKTSNNVVEFQNGIFRCYERIDGSWKLIKANGEAVEGCEPIPDD